MSFEEYKRLSCENPANGNGTVTLEPEADVATEGHFRPRFKKANQARERKAEEMP
jgi:hypothetical protein